ncbi:hypothetical protein F4775DRAFT_542843 [Biscogniauxia sp. FL1348]|nr:hypothetical protein F4775DRAFT_542843 [Biscogniauxia sp. FL1348]
MPTFPGTCSLELRLCTLTLSRIIYIKKMSFVQRVANTMWSRCGPSTTSRFLGNSPSAAAVVRKHAIRARYSSLARGSSEGKNVIVTGSSRGIGKAIALRLALDGYNVCINDIAANKAGCDEVASEIRGMGRKALTAIADVTKRDEVKDMIQTTVRELGPLNTMVANAGIVQATSLLDVTDDDFKRMFEINVFGLHVCFSEAARQLISQGTCGPEQPGKLIGAASIVAFRPLDLLPHYSASKFAVRGLTQSYAMELAGHGITVNSYAPGIIGTKMWDHIDEAGAAARGLRRGELMERLVHELTALDRPGTPADVAGLVSFLASSDSDFITGQTKIVDGGITFS